MLPINVYPYLNLNDLNLDYVLKTIGELRYEVTNFVSLNAIKYADPIQWDITRQYEKNTIVIDPVTGTAYISVAPVPAGVALTRTEYWTVVFDLGSFVTRAAQNFTSHWESETTTTATFNTSMGGWLVWGDVLYKALTNITAGDAYVVGSNIEHFTIEDLYNSYLNTVAQILAIIGDLVDLNTSDKTSIVNAINSVVSDIAALDLAINTKIGDLADLNTSDKTSIVNAINSEMSERINADNNLENEIRNIAAFKDLTAYNVSGSNNTYYGSIVLGATQLTFSSLTDYKAGHGLLIERAGDVPSLTPVSNFNAVYTGAAGSATHEYAICKITNKFGCTPAVTATVTGCAASFSRQNYVTLTFDQDPNAFAYLVYKDNVLVDILSQNIANYTIDWQLTAITVPFNVPNTPPTGYVNEYLKTSIVDINGNDATINDTAKNSISGAKIIHDDTDEIQKAINENQLLYVPSGHYNVSITSFIYCLLLPSNCEIYGDGSTSVFYSHFSIAHGAIMLNDCNAYGGTNKDIVLRQFAINTNATNTDHVSGITFRRPAIYMATNSPLNKPRNIKIDNLTISNVSHGISMASIVNGVISHCYIYNCVADACGCYDACEHCVIEYNTLVKTGDDAIGCSNSLLDNTQNIDVKINGNYISQSGAHGIRVEGAYHSITNNFIEATAVDGIYIHKYPNTVTQLINVVGNKCQGIGAYTLGVGGGLAGTWYDIALRDETTPNQLGYLSTIAIVGNELADNDAIGIIGINTSDAISNVQIAGNTTIWSADYDISGTIPPQNVHSFSQKQTGTTSITTIANTMVSQTVTFPHMAMKPTVSIYPETAANVKINYAILNVTQTSFDFYVICDGVGTFTFRYVVEC